MYDVSDIFDAKMSIPLDIFDQLITTDTKMSILLPVQNRLSLIKCQYLFRALQPNNPSHSVVTSPSAIGDRRKTLQSWFLHRVVPYLSSSILLKLFPIPNFF